MQIKSQIRFGFRIGFTHRAIALALGLFVSAASVFGAEKEILSDKDKAQYTRIFALHEQGDYIGAQAAFDRIHDKLLEGYVLYDRYFSAKYKTSPDEIKSWLKAYGSLPVADRMRKLAAQKGVKGYAREKGSAESLTKCLTHRRDEAIDLVKKRTFNDIKNPTAARVQFDKLAQYLAEGKTLAARNLIDSGAFSKAVPQADMALARTALGFSYFLDAEYDLALTQIEKAVRLNDKATPLTFWTGGLVKWQQGDYNAAGDYFAKAAKHEGAYPLMNAGASFWAARSYLKSGAYEKVGRFLEAAAQHPQMFYGMLAIHLMGLEKNYIWSSALSGESAVDKTYSTPALNRFYALKQLGKNAEALGELALAFQTADTDGRRIIAGIATRLGWRDNLKALTKPKLGENESYPLPKWTPNNGWTVDKALVLAIVRQESCFNPSAKSAVGAQGVMQIMPQTAELIAKQSKMKWQPDKIGETGYNLALGQQYIKYLLKLPAVDNNLIYLAVAYNAGPGNLIKWKKKTNYPADPLIFIESLPSWETRIFVERIMLNYWIYQTLMGRSADTAREIIAGAWPLYHHK